MKSFIFNLFISLLIVSTTHAGSPRYDAFRVEVSGSGPALFLIPGATSSGDVWREAANRYRDHYTVHLFTLAGYAGVPPLSATEILPEIKRQLTRYIRENSHGEGILIGHSIGGFLGLWMAADEKGLIDRLVIVDALPFLPAARNPALSEEQAKQAFLRYRNHYTGMDSAALRLSQEMILRSMIKNSRARDAVLEQSLLSDRRTMGMTLYELMSTDLRDDLARIAIPMLVLIPWDDSLDPQSGMDRGQKLSLYRGQYAGAPHCRVRLIENARHFIMLDQPDSLFKDIDAFLSVPTTDEVR